MAATFVIVDDDQHKAFINLELICMFRCKLDADGKLASPEEVEIHFIGGGKTKLNDETACYFLSAVQRFIPK